MSLPSPAHKAHRADKALADVATATEGILQIRDRFSVRGLMNDMEFRTDEDKARRDALDELTGLSDELGLYD